MTPMGIWAFPGPCHQILRPGRESCKRGHRALSLGHMSLVHLAERASGTEFQLMHEPWVPSWGCSLHPENAPYVLVVSLTIGRA